MCAFVCLCVQVRMPACEHECGHACVFLCIHLCMRDNSRLQQRLQRQGHSPASCQALSTAEALKCKRPLVRAKGWLCFLAGPRAASRSTFIVDWVYTSLMTLPQAQCSMASPASRLRCGSDCPPGSVRGLRITLERSN